MQAIDILLIQEDEAIRSLTKRYAEDRGFKISHEATTTAEAIRSIEYVACGAMACNAMIVDPKMRPGRVNLGNDSTAILGNISIFREDLRKLGVVIVNFSSVIFEDYGVTPDIEMDPFLSPASVMDALSMYEA